MTREQTSKYARDANGWRGELVPCADFQCACGCDLQLSRGDLADAMRIALLVAENPRYTSGRPTITPRTQRPEPPEPEVRRLCPKCRFTVVAIPTYAAEMLASRGASWPNCESCRKS